MVAVDMSRRRSNRLIVPSAHARDDEGYLPAGAGKRDGARIALVTVGVRSQEDVRQDAGLCARVIDVGEHRRAARVTRGAERRMVRRKQQGLALAAGALLLDRLQRGDQPLLLVRARNLAG